MMIGAISDSSSSRSTGRLKPDRLAVGPSGQVGHLERHLLLLRQGERARARPRPPAGLNADGQRGIGAAELAETPSLANSLGGPARQHAVEVLAAEVVVAVVVEHLEPTGAGADERDVERPAAEVVDQPVPLAA